MKRYMILCIFSYRELSLSYWDACRIEQVLENLSDLQTFLFFCCNSSREFNIYFLNDIILW